MFNLVLAKYIKDKDMVKERVVKRSERFDDLVVITENNWKHGLSIYADNQAETVLGSSLYSNPAYSDQYNLEGQNE